MFFSMNYFIGGLEMCSIHFAPLAVVHQRQYCPRNLSSPLAFFSISTDFTPPQRIPVPSNRLKVCRMTSFSGVEPQA